jgi:CDP-glucose 4,6-dehydratase
LQNLGANLVGYSLPPPTTPSLFDIVRVEEGMTSIIGDVREYEQFHSVIAGHRPEIIFHMAAQSLVRHSYDNPVETYATNVMGTVHLLEAVRQVGGVKAIVNITSDKCYENQEWPWGYRENEPMGGFDPYSNSKGCAELITSAFRNSFFNPEDFDTHGVALASARSGNVIGGGDWAKDRLIPDIMRAISEGKPVVVRNPDSIRPWQHVLEPLSGYLLLAQKLFQEGKEFAQAWNFGPNDEDAKPVSWIATHMTQMWGKDASWKLDGKKHPHEAHYLKLDCSKAKSQIGWSPTWNLETTLRAIVSWNKEYLAQKDMRVVVTDQINAFLKENI